MTLTGCFISCPVKHLAGKRCGESLADDSLKPHCADSINVFPLEFSNLYISITFPLV